MSPVTADCDIPASFPNYELVTKRIICKCLRGLFHLMYPPARVLEKSALRAL